MLAGDIRSVTVDPTDDKVIYSGVEPVALYRSEDGGENWQELTTLQEVPETARKNWWFPQPPHKGHIRNIFIHPDHASIIYLCIEHGGIVRSFDRGKSWEDVSKGIDYLDIHVIAIRGGEWIDTTSPPRGAFSPVINPIKVGYAENGLTRNYFHDFLFLPAVKSDEKPTMILATADQSPGFWRRENRGARAALFKSADGAESWTRITNGLADDLDSMIWALVHHPTDHRSVFAGFGNVARGHASGSGGAGDLMVSRDMGESWQRLNIDLPADRVLWAAAD